jgi:hypothetical protein
MTTAAGWATIPMLAASLGAMPLLSCAPQETSLSGPNNPASNSATPAAPAAAAAAPGNGLEELPSVSAVRAAITGATPAETAARQEAAFATLADYVVTRVGGVPQDPKGYDLLNSYEIAQDPKAPMAMLHGPGAAAAVYFDSLDFREQVLRKYVSKASFDYYVANSESVQQARNRLALRAEQAEWQRRVEPDVSRANKDQLLLLGVPMGADLTVPYCGEIGVDPKAAIGGQLAEGIGLGAFMPGLEEARGGAALKKPPACLYNDADGQEIVWLQTPAWIVRSDATVKGHMLLGAALTVRETDDLFKQLARKYGNPTTSKKAVFQNGYGARFERPAAEWALPGVHVLYTPQDGDVQMPVGELRIELNTLYQARQAAQAQKDAAGPQL